VEALFGAGAVVLLFYSGKMKKSSGKSGSLALTGGGDCFIIL